METLFLSSPKLNFLNVNFFFLCRYVTRSAYTMMETCLTHILLGAQKS